MTVSLLTRLSDSIREDTDLIIREWIIQVMRIPSAREVDRPTLIDHIPDLLVALCQDLREHEEKPIERSDSNDASEQHGTLRFQTGFDLVEVVAEYNALREVLMAFAEERGISLEGSAGRLVHRTVDHAIAFAVKAYATEKTLELQRRREEQLSFIVHDLKTPLSAIETSMVILDTKYPDPNAASARFLAIIRRNAHRLHALISKLLQEQGNLQTRSTTLEKRELDVWPLVEQLAHDFSPLADANHVRIVNDVPEDLSINADAHAISRVFQNLLANAIKHSPNGVITISGHKSGDCVELSVADTGEGIAPDRVEKIFQKLETDSTDEGALGLGLAIVKSVVESHGGEVSVQTALGQGTKFFLTIPDPTIP